MEKKGIVLELHYDIDALIELQKVTLSELRKDNMPKSVIAFQEDIMTILKMASKINKIDLNTN